MCLTAAGPRFRDAGRPAMFRKVRFEAIGNTLRKFAAIPEHNARQFCNAQTPAKSSGRRKLPSALAKTDPLALE